MRRGDGNRFIYPVQRRTVSPANDLSSDEIERTAGRTWFVGGIFVGFGASPVIAVAIFAIARLFFGSGIAAIIVVMAAVLSFAVGLAYVALARVLEE